MKWYKIWSGALVESAEDEKYQCFDDSFTEEEIEGALCFYKSRKVNKPPKEWIEKKIDETLLDIQKKTELYDILCKELLE